MVIRLRGGEDCVVCVHLPQHNSHGMAAKCARGVRKCWTCERISHAFVQWNLLESLTESRPSRNKNLFRAEGEEIASIKDKKYIFLSLMLERGGRKDFSWHRNVFLSPSRAPKGDTKWENRGKLLNFSHGFVLRDLWATLGRWIIVTDLMG